MARELINTRRYKAGYEIRYIRMTGDDAAGGDPIIHRQAYTPDGHYIGNPRTAHRLTVTLGIQPEPAPNGNCSGRQTCTIGFCDKEQKWYGWSHRALHGFGLGDVIQEGDSAASSGWAPEYLAEHPEKDHSLPIGFEAVTMADAKRMAIAFADSVG